MFFFLSDKKCNKKYRNFTFLVYPEAMPDNFSSVLADSGGKGFYIFHDLDKREDGTDKPAHWHVVVMFENQRHLNSIRKLGLRCGAANGYVEPVGDLNVIARYLCHMDDPNKHQYDSSEVTCFGGADYLELCETKSGRKAKRLEAVCQMMDYISENKIYSFSNLADYCRAYRRDWLEYLLVPSVGRSIMEYLKSKNWTDNRQLSNI